MLEITAPFRTLQTTHQSLLPHVHKGITNTFWSMSKLSLQMKHNIFHYRVGHLLNQKHAVRFKMSASLQCPLCQQADSALFIPHTLCFTLKSLALMYKKPIRLPLSYMLILCSMHTNWQLLDALFKNPVALKVLVWSRGWLVTLQILTRSSFSLVEETHGSSGQCISFSLKKKRKEKKHYVGSETTPYIY